jgi:hypothetical protein
VAGNITDTCENLLLDHILGTTSFTPTGPIKVALMTANGSDASAGTEVVAGGNAYARQTLTCGAASAGATSNSGTLTWSNMPSCTVVGVEIYDSNATPKRLWWGPLTANKVVNAGDTFQILTGALTLSLD